MKAPDSLLEVRNLRVEFPSAFKQTNVALRNLDLEIRSGEILGLVGESGAGKTTLARSILKLPPAPGRITGGEVWFDKRDLLKASEKELQRIRGRDISIIVPNPRGELNPLKRVGDQIALMARIHLGLSRKNARHAAMEMLKTVQIPDPERRYQAFPHELSGGMAQRVVIGISLVCSPKFIIADDATSGLDVTVQAQILDLMQQLAKRLHNAMLFITRDVGITAHLCDRIAVIYAGAIMEIAPRDAFFFQPQHPYTNMLLAAFSHNPELRRRWSGPGRSVSNREALQACIYADRCPRSQPYCREVAPALREVMPNHFVRCHFPVVRP